MDLQEWELDIIYITALLKTPTWLDSSTAAVARSLLLPIELQPSSPARTTTKHVQVRLVRVILELAATASAGRKTLSQFHQLDYLGNSIAASVAVAGGGDEIR